MDETARSFFKATKGSLGLDRLPNGQQFPRPFSQDPISALMGNAPTAPSGAFGGLLGNAAVDTTYHNLYKDALKASFDYREALMRKEVGQAVDPEVLEDYRIKANETADAFSKFNQALTQTPGKAKDAINAFFNVGYEVENTVRELTKAMTEGITPFEKYVKTMHDLNVAANGALPTDRTAAAAVMGGFPIFGNPKLDPLIGGDELGVGRFMAYEKLRGSVKSRADNMAPAAFAGSREAADLINRAGQQQLSTEQQVLQTLRDAKTVEERQAVYLAEIAGVLKSPQAQQIGVKAMKIDGGK